MLPGGQGRVAYPTVGLPLHHSPPRLLEGGGDGDGREGDYLSKYLSNYLCFW